MNDAAGCIVSPSRKRAGVLLALVVVLFAVGGEGRLYADRVEATFAGGCFWCMQGPMEEIPGVIDTIVGFSGGTLANPSYKTVVENDTGHYEVVQVIYDDDRVDYDQLLDVFWKNVDPYDAGGQFCDRGDSYLTAIFYHSNKQQRLATRSLSTYDKVHSADIVTPIIEFTAFYPAEEYHQDYHMKNRGRYKVYRALCGRDRRLRELWEK